MSSIRLVALTKRYGALTVVDHVSFAGERGEFVTLLGPSGCGKTTTLRMIAGFVVPTSGRIEIGDRDATQVPPNRRDVALVFQNYALFPHMTVSANVAFGLRMRGIGRDERNMRVAQALEMVKLRGFEDRFPKALSGGQQQRVALARALVINPQLLLLDEPFGALDKQLRDHMRDELSVLQRRLGIATVFVTHDQQEALALSDRVIVMNGGRIEQIGKPTDIYERPRSRFVAEFLGRSNLIEMQVRELRADTMRLARGGFSVRDAPAAALRDGYRDDPAGVCFDHARPRSRHPRRSHRFRDIPWREHAVARGDGGRSGVGGAGRTKRDAIRFTDAGRGGRRASRSRRRVDRWR